MPVVQVSRGIEIDRPPEEVFDAVVDYSTWTSWSPWLQIERGADVSIYGEPSSVGAVYRWEGELVGSGEMEHRVLNRPGEIEDELRIRKPFKTRSTVRFVVDPLPHGSRLTWVMDGRLPWFLFPMRSSMETFIGMDYERGLQMLKDHIETGHVLSQTDVVGVESVPHRVVMGLRDSCPRDQVGPVMERVFGEVKSQFAKVAPQADREMISVYHPCDMKQGCFDFTCGLNVTEEEIEGLPDFTKCDLPAGRALHVRHTGSYKHLGNAWSGAYQYARYSKLKPLNRDAYEVYANDPSVTPESEWLTELYVPVG
jgi:effector-binding domain-containing protein